jgi:hypothetical protein
MHANTAHLSKGKLSCYHLFSVASYPWQVLDLGLGTLDGAPGRWPLKSGQERERDGE